MRSVLAMLALFSIAASLSAADGKPPVAGNRLAYLDEFCDPYYAGLHTPRFVTPQWVGEPDVEAVVVLSIDDLVDTALYERFLRPIFDRLKSIDGRAPVSIMTKHVDPRDPLLEKWFAEGVSIEAHTYDHPCPCLQAGDAEKSKETFDRCIDLLATIPRHRSVAFRMPCCDSMNSASPRFFAEIFNRTTPGGNFLEVDSSIFVIPTPHDRSLPRELLLDQGTERFRRYLPASRGFVNYIEDYPYPFVISRLCWELPAITPDDWQGFNRNDRCHPATLADMKAALDAVVIKQGVFVLTFHPHNWIRNDQVIDLIDYAVGKYGRRIKFLNFPEVRDRITDNALAGQPLRSGSGRDNGVRLLDVDGDGYMDVVIGNEHLQQTRIWSPAEKAWITADFPVPLVAADAQGIRRDTGVHFGVLQAGGQASALVRSEQMAGLWHFTGRQWLPDPWGLAGLELTSLSPGRKGAGGGLEPSPFSPGGRGVGGEGEGLVFTSRDSRDQGVRLVDIDGDGTCELIVSRPRQNAVFAWRGGQNAASERGWSRLPFALPEGTSIINDRGGDAGLRLVDLDGDGRLDVVFSNSERFGVSLFANRQTGWSRQVFTGLHGSAKDLPPIVRADGGNNGAWFKYHHMWLQNEDTSKKLPKKPSDDDFVHLTDSRSYAEMLGGDASHRPQMPTEKR